MRWRVSGGWGRRVVGGWQEGGGGGGEGGGRGGGGGGGWVGGCSGILLCDSHQPQGVAKGQIRR